MGDDVIKVRLLIDQNTVQSVEGQVRNLVSRLNNQRITLTFNTNTVNNCIAQLERLEQTARRIQNANININTALTETQQNYRLETERIRAMTEQQRIAQQISVERERTLQSENNAISALSRENRTLTVNRNLTQEVNENVRHTHEHIRRAGDATNNFVTGLGRGLQYIIQYRLLNEAINKITEAYRELKAVDDAMVGYRKVTGASKEDVKAISEEAFKNASKYARLASEYAESTERFAKAGYGDRSSALSEVALLAQNTGDIENELANEFLVSADAAWKLNGDVSELSKILDYFNELSNRTATTVDNLASGITVSGSMFAQAGLSAQDYAAIIGTATAKTQRSGEEMSRAWRTIIMSLSQIRGTDLETGDVIDADKLAKAEKTLNSIGIQIREVVNGQNELRNPMRVLEDIADKWEELTSIQQSALAESISNKRQSNAFISVIENWQDVEKAIAITANSNGSALRENEIYLDSWSAKSKQLSAEWAEYIANMSDVELIKGSLDLLASAINLLDTPLGRLISQMLMVNTALALTGRLWNGIRARSIIADTLAVGLAEGKLGTAVGLVTKQLWAQATAWLASPLGMATAAVAGISLLIAGISEYNKKLEESRQEMIEIGKEATKLTNDLEGLIEQYRKLGEDGAFDNSDREQAKNIQEQINELLGESVGYIDLANGSYEEQLGLLKKLQLQKANETYADKREAKQAAEDSLLSTVGVEILELNGGGFTNQSEMDAYEKFLKGNGFSKYIKETDVGDVVFQAEINGAEDAIDVYDDLIKIKTVLSTKYEDEIQKAGELQGFYEEVCEKVKDWSEAVQKYKDALGDYELNKSVIDFNETDFGGVKGALIENEEQLKSWINAMLDSNNISDSVKENLITLANVHMPQYSDSIKEIVKSHIELKAKSLSTQNVLDGEVDELYKLGVQSGLARKEIVDLISTQIIFNKTSLSVTGKVQALAELATQLGITTSKAIGLNNALAGNTDPTGRSQMYNTAQAYGIKRVVDGWLYNGKTYNSMGAAIQKAMADEVSGWYSNDNQSGRAYGDGTTSDKGNSDKPGKADPTDAIINRIGSNVEALERQGEIIDNQLDMVDAEKEYDKYVELTNKALDNRLKTIEASKTAQNELSKEAQKIRNKYKGVDVDSFFDADGDFTEAYNKYYESFGSKAKQEAFEDDMKMIQAFKKEWFEYYDDIMGLEKEVFDFRKELQESYYDHLSNLIDQLERHADLREKQAEDDKEYYDYLIDKEQALLDMKKAQFGLENKLLSARREAEKALASSKIGSEYLDEETRKLVYNEDDYELEMDKIREISGEVDGLTEEYISKLNKLGEEEIYKAEEITAQYERRLALKEKELEIVQAEIDLQKKQDTLNNVLAEKNIRQIVDGKWAWTHDTDQLRQATEDLADAKAQVEQLEREKHQLEYTNSLEARIGQWQLEQEAIDQAMEHLRDRIDDFSTKVELLEEPLENFADLINELTAELGGEPVGDESSGVITASLSSAPNSGRIGSIDPNADMASTIQQMKNNSIVWHVSDSVTKEKLHDENKKLAASIGADYNPVNGKYYQHGKPLYDSGGVLEGLGGIKATKDDEIILPPNITSNILDPKKNALFDTFANNLETIFNPDLMPIQQIPFNIPQPNLKLLDTVTNRNTVVNQNMYGDVNITEANDIDNWMTMLINKIKSMPIPD